MILHRNTHLRQIQKLTLPLTCLKGVGPRRARLLAQKGLHTILDLLFFMPIRYEDRTRIFPIDKTDQGRAVLVKGRVVFGREERFYPSRKRLFRITIRDAGAPLELLWFQYRRPHLERFAALGTQVLAFGRIQINREKRQMIHPEIVLSDDPGTKNSVGLALGYYPVYSSVIGISGGILRSMIRETLRRYLRDLIDPIPVNITARLNLPDLKEAIRFVHFPPEESSFSDLNQFMTPFHKRLIFDRFFLVMLTMAYRKRSKQDRACPIFSIPPGMRKDLEGFFPFRLTPYQMRVIEDVFRDFAEGRCMNRLLLGDVGCGKTAVAAVAAHVSVRNGHQVAMMVPTQELALQQFEYFLNFSDKIGFRPVLLTGRLRKSERQDIYDNIRNGRYNVIIGTQSLIQEELQFAKLGLVVIDEQQRFGVRDRALMDRKGENPHTLVMTATPIPRTLAITLYGDMDLSFIGGYPEGRMPVTTQLVAQGEKRGVFELLRQRMSLGQQAFVICPIIEGTEDMDLKNALEMAEKLKKIFSPPFRVGLVHGRMSADEREKVMNGFRGGLIHLLVGTTVVEVGVHVPKATVMVVEHPERFGLAQLHQLRGRVGRGAQRGVCLLMLPNNLSERAKSRLRILVETYDGFDIAIKDLEMRGQGELIGMKQAGMGELYLAEMMRESELLSMAKGEATSLVDADPGLLRPENSQLRVMVDAILSRPLDL